MNSVKSGTPHPRTPASSNVQPSTNSAAPGTPHFQPSIQPSTNSAAPGTPHVQPSTNSAAPGTPHFQPSTNSPFPGTPRFRAWTNSVTPGTPFLAPSPFLSLRPVLRGSTIIEPGTTSFPFQSPSSRISMTPRIGTPSIHLPAQRCQGTESSKYGTQLEFSSSRTCPTPGTPVVQISPAPKSIPPTPTSSFAISMADVDVDSSDEELVEGSGSERCVIGEGAERNNGRTTPLSERSSGSSGLYSPLPDSSAQLSPPTRNRSLNDSSECSESSRNVTSSAWTQRRESMAAISPASSSGQMSTPPSNHSSRPDFQDPVASTPLGQGGVETDFQAWLASRGNRESVISCIRNLNSNTSRISQRLSNWNTPGRSSGTVIGSQGSINEDILLQRRQVLEGIHDEHDVVHFNEAVLSVVWGGGKLGAAYYNIESSELFLVPDITESAPDFTILKSLNKQVRPKFLVASSRQDERFLEVLKSLVAVEHGTEEEDADREVDGPQLFIQSGRDFAPDACRQRLQALRLPEESKTHDAREHLLFITSLIPFSSEIMVRAAGALLKFLDKSAIELLQLDLVDGVVPVLSVNISSMNDLVMVDETAWNSLQIFSVDFHPAASTKLGNWGGSKEGLSVFNLLNRCNSTQGTKALKLQLLRPTRNVDLLNRRYDVIQFCVDPARTEFIRTAATYMKSIKSLPKLLFKLSMLHTTVREWKELYQTIYHCILLGELTAYQPDSVQLLGEVGIECKSEVLRATSQEMMRVIDFEQSSLQGHFVAKHGITPELDKKRQEYACLPEIMSMVAAEEMNTLPEFVQQCSVVYIPEVGYLLALSSWQEGLEMEDYEIEGLEFKFTNQGLVYYKSPRVHELDIVLGDCQVAIMDLEACIMIYLTETILRNSTKLLKIGTLVSELDSLMAMASVAREHNYVRPRIVRGEERIEIVGGRHPLVEQICEFVPNSTLFEGEEKIVVLTGPNASGKSIYLKQVGVLVLMALSGSFVPAISAIIPTLDKLCTRIHAKESVSTGLSTFLIDINQMSLALRSATKSSLVIVDEFGKGTAEADGLSLLIATVEDFTRRGEESPTILLSTHYYSLMDHLNYSPLVKPQTMEFMKEDNRIVYLFKLKSGSCKSSFAHLVAENVGIPEATVHRSLEIEEVVRRQLGEESIEVRDFGLTRTRQEDLMRSLGDEFLALDLSSIEPLAYMQRIFSLLNPFMHDSESPLLTGVRHQDTGPPRSTPYIPGTFRRSNSDSTLNSAPSTFMN